MQDQLPNLDKNPGNTFEILAGFCPWRLWLRQGQWCGVERTFAAVGPMAVLVGQRTIDRGTIVDTQRSIKSISREPPLPQVLASHIASDRAPARP